MKTLLVVALVGMFCSGSVVAGFTGGNALLAQCQGVLPYVAGDEIKGGPTIAKGMCVGLVEGVLKTMQSLNSHLPNEFKTCFLERSVTIGEAVQAVVDYLWTTELRDTDDATFSDVCHPRCLSLQVTSHFSGEISNPAPREPCTSRRSLIPVREK
ncbi:hypothetical protein [Pseudomonas sp. 2822-17]|uniref:hypothetical protein n=1 Tax=Pseudomonas sp. 2822-17 TaxID=1712678 RepID=UPI00117B9570|nr:hypothetical protein [Pseudomonas sp. 2822-17]